MAMLTFCVRGSKCVCFKNFEIPPVPNYNFEKIIDEIPTVVIYNLLKTIDEIPPAVIYPYEKVDNLCGRYKINYFKIFAKICYFAW